MDLLWRSLNGLKCSDHYDECSRMVMLNTRFSIHFEKEPCIQANGNNILWFTVEIMTSCDCGLGLWTVVLIKVTIIYWWDGRGLILWLLSGPPVFTCWISLLWYSVLFSVEILSSLYLLFISLFICSRRRFIDKLGVFHSNQTSMCLDRHRN